VTLCATIGHKFDGPVPDGFPEGRGGEDKSAEERGAYIHPELYGEPESNAVDAARREAKEENSQ
jgi:hypothetical protein